MEGKTTHLITRFSIFLCLYGLAPAFRLFRVKAMIFLLYFLLGIIPLSLAADKNLTIPPELEPWKEWALHGNEEKLCPIAYNSKNRNLCSWPGTLTVTATVAGGEFEQSREMFSEGWVELPGDKKNWPQKVRLKGKDVPVMGKGDIPLVFLAKGKHLLRGSFVWSAVPESLRIPSDTGLVSLKVSGKNRPYPEVDSRSLLWLKRNMIVKKEEGDSHQLTVFRKIADNIPLQVTTQIELTVSGSSREMLLGPLFSGDFIPMSINSPLPSRLEKNNTLLLQVRPGRWVITVTARLKERSDTISFPATSNTKAFWVNQEVHVFEAHNDLRQVRVEGLQAIDPEQTTLPSHWRKLPSYLVKPGDVMKLAEKKRGNPDPEPDKLSLDRQIWLDFNGGGYTLLDSISGLITSGWRLEMQIPVKLGKVEIDEKPRFITRREGSSSDGVEIRRGTLQLEAVSRINESTRKIPAVGWQKDFSNVSAILNLPPGWDLFYASGVDNVSHSWVTQWTLLDIFLVLITAIAVFRLFGLAWGGIALLTLVLTFKESGAPQWIWLNILFAAALLKVVTGDRLRKTVQSYRILSLLALLLIVLPYSVTEIRSGIYPQLAAQPSTFMQDDQMVMQNQMEMEVASDEAVGEARMEEKSILRKMMAEPSYLMQSYAKAPVIQRKELPLYDPDTVVQTGPGIPDWDWQTIQLSWNGPVNEGQEISLTLISPAVNLVLAFLRVFLIGALIFCLLEIPLSKGFSLLRQQGKGLLALLLLPVLLLASPDYAKAEMPSKEILNELRERLIAPPDCLPNCASLNRMLVKAGKSGIRMRMEIDASDEVAVPLPGNLRNWKPERVILDGKETAAVQKDRSQNLWLLLSAGKHQVIIEGGLPLPDKVIIPLLMKPHVIEVSLRGWKLKGVHNNQLLGNQFQLEKIKKKGQEETLSLKPGDLPPLVMVERTLNLGLQWEVTTVVRRITPAGSPLLLSVPLLKGESVTTPNTRIKEGKALVSISSQQREKVWSSTFKEMNQFILKASEDTAIIETWKVNVSPIWHAEIAGIPVIHHQGQSGNWFPEWRPWPNEEVTLTVSRPSGVDGQTLTVSQSQTMISPGIRSTDVTLALDISSSQGTRHKISLPEGAELQSVFMEGKPVSFSHDTREVVLSILPGFQHAEIQWRENRGIETFFTTPELNIGTPSVNNRIDINLPPRWVLFASGPQLGPAVLFWGVLIVVLLIAALLGQVKITPLKTWQWMLLAIGLTQAPPFIAMVIVGWLLVMGWRREKAAIEGNRKFNFLQVLLVLLVLAAIMSVIFVVQQGLLGNPEMQITGNHSTSSELHWYQDRSGEILPQASVISVSMLYYRIAMLLWALWLAFSMLNWLQWSWECLNTNGFWRSKKKAQSPSDNK